MRLGGYGIDIRNQLGLRDGQLTTTDQERTERTLTTTRIPLSSDF